MTEQQQKPVETIVLEIVGRYVSRRLKGKYDLDWTSASTSDTSRQEYGEKKAKIAKDAFLAVRARTGADFIDYFVSTLCSVPQHMTDESFTSLSAELYRNTDRIRTLTLLALSARS